MRIIELKETGSTNSWVAAHREELPMPSLVYALNQTQGRGQRGNSWESEPGMNLCASVLLRPVGVEPRRQFTVSEAVALAVTDLLGECGIDATVKWPNDIYVGDSKICGILIEHAVMPREILYTIAGIGINVNQTRFLSDAPNPVSMKQLTGLTYQIDTLADGLGVAIERRLGMMSDNPDLLHEEFMARLWRGDGGRYPFFDRLRVERVDASIADVGRDGIMTLDVGGELRMFAFKEVEFII